MPQPRHPRRTQHVQHHLLRSPRLQPRRPCQHFRPHLRRNHNFRQPPHRHAQVRSHRHRRRPTRTRILQRPHHVRRRPASRNSHHHVVPRQFLRAQIPLPISRRILRPFHRSSNRAPSPRNQRLHQLRRSPKRRRTFRSIQHSHSPARSRPHINQPPALSNRPHNRIHRPRNRRNLPPHRRPNLLVLAVHQPHDLRCRHAVEILRRRIPLFRAATLRAPVFSGLRRHCRIIQASESVPWHSHSWLCASDKRNGLSAGTMCHHASRALRKIATRRQPNHITGNQLC